MRIPLKAGRLLEARDGAESRARRGDQRRAGAALLGRPATTRSATRCSSASPARPTEVEIVGVVGALRHDRLDRGARDELFMPLAQMPFGSMTFVVRSGRRCVGAASNRRAPPSGRSTRQQTIYRTATLDELVQKTVSPRRFALAVIIGFAVLALLLAIAGVYGVLSAIMTARLREVGLRVALGASRWDIVRLRARAGGRRWPALGLVIGLAGSLGAAATAAQLPVRDHARRSRCPCCLGGVDGACRAHGLLSAGATRRFRRSGHDVAC